jgi:hypothetical protein
MVTAIARPVIDQATSCFDATKAASGEQLQRTRPLMADPCPGIGAGDRYG